MELPGASGFQRCLEALHAAFPALNVVDAAPIDDGLGQLRHRDQQISYIPIS